MATLSERISDLNEMMRANQQLMQRLAENQAGLTPVLRRLAEARDGPDGAEGLRDHMRNVERLLGRLLNEGEQGRAQSTAELRGDLRLLTRTLAALGGENAS